MTCNHFSLVNPETNEPMKCGGPIKPNITFVGEDPLNAFDYGIDRMKQDENDPTSGVDLIIVIGSKLKLSPFNTAIDIDEGKGRVPCPKVLIGLSKPE